MGDFDAGLLQCPADSTPVASKLGGQFIGAGSSTVLFYDLADIVIGQAFLFLRISIDFGIGSIGSVGHIRIDIETAGLKGCIMLCPVFEYARGRVETRSQKCHHMKHLRDMNPCGFIGRCFYSIFNRLEDSCFWTGLEICANF